MTGANGQREDGSGFTVNGQGEDGSGLAAVGIESGGEDSGRSERELGFCGFDAFDNYIQGPSAPPICNPGPPTTNTCSPGPSAFRNENIGPEVFGLYEFDPTGSKVGNRVRGEEKALDDDCGWDDAYF